MPEVALTPETFVPTRLRLARELKEWSQTDLASELRKWSDAHPSRRGAVTSAALGQYESGMIRPARDMLAALAEVLDVPAAFFALRVVDTHDGFFRSTRRTPVAHRRHARALAHITHDLATTPAAAKALPPVYLPRISPPDLDADRKEIEKIAGQVRRAWGLPRGPIPNMVTVLEDHGIVVLRLPLATADVDAFSLPFEDRPVVVLGTDKNDRARSRFDGAHELGHLIMHGERVWGLKQVEDQAHQFAAAFLMPEQDIIHELPDRPNWGTLFDLKRRWQVSLAALLMRAKNLGRMGDAAYLTGVKAISVRGWRRVEPVPLGSPEAPAHLRRLTAADTGVRAALPKGVVQSVLGANAV